MAKRKKVQEQSALKVHNPDEKSFVLLHGNLGILAKMCAGESRYAITGVRLTITEDGYRCDATDGRFLAIVEGEQPYKPEEFPDIPGMTSIANGSTEGVIPKDEWEKIFKEVPTRPARDVLRCVAVRMGKDDAMFGTTNLETSGRSRYVRKLEGRFPPLDEVVPKKNPIATVRFNASLLGQLCKVAQTFSDENAAIELSVIDPATPVLVRCSRPEQRFTGIIMPLVPEGTDVKGHVQECNEHASKLSAREAKKRLRRRHIESYGMKMRSLLHALTWQSGDKKKLYAAARQLLAKMEESE